MKTFIYHVCLKEKMNSIDWKWSEKEGKIRCELKLKAKPEKVLYYTADTEKRDFREVKWEGKELLPDAKGKYIFEREKPKTGYTGSYIEVVFRSEDKTPYSVFTTPYVK